MDKIKVLQVVQTLEMGGLEKMAVDLIRFSDRERFEFSVCSLSEKGALAGDLEKDGIEVMCLDKNTGLDLGLSLKIASIIKKKKINILHTHNQRPQLYGALARLFSGVPVHVHTRHSRNEPDNFKNLLLSRFSSGFIDKTVCVCEEVYRYVSQIEKLPFPKLAVIMNGIDVRNFDPGSIDRATVRKALGIRDEEKVIGTVGRAVPVKNQACLIDGFKELLQKVPDSKLLIVGDGPLKEGLMQYARKLDIAGNVLFLGERRDIARLLRAMDVFALPSLSEGMSLVLLEAMAMGLPIVATNVGGNPELVADGVNGLLVKAGDPAGMKDALAKILQDKEMARKMGEDSRRRVLSYYSVENMAKQYEELYRSELSRKGGVVV